MDTQLTNIKVIARDAYEFAQSLGVMASLTFEEFCGKAELEKIVSEAERTQKNWPQVRKMWESKGVEKNLIDQWGNDVINYEKRYLGRMILENAEAQKKSFSIDWKWSPEDLIWNVEQLIPELPIKFVSEVFNEKTKTYQVIVKSEGKEISLEVTYSDPLQLMNFINGKLPNEFNTHVFVQYYTGGDSYGFLLMTRSLVQKYMGNEFIPYSYEPIYSTFR